MAGTYVAAIAVGAMCGVINGVLIAWMRITGINKIGMRRSGMKRENIAKLDQAFKIIFRSPHILLKDAIVMVKEEIPDCPEVDVLVDFFQTSKRGVVKRTIDD